MDPEVLRALAQALFAGSPVGRGPEEQTDLREFRKTGGGAVVEGLAGMTPPGIAIDLAGAGASASEGDMLGVLGGLLGAALGPVSGKSAAEGLQFLRSRFTGPIRAANEAGATEEAAALTKSMIRASKQPGGFQFNPDFPVFRSEIEGLERFAILGRNVRPGEKPFRITLLESVDGTLTPISHVPVNSIEEGARFITDLPDPMQGGFGALSGFTPLTEAAEKLLDQSR